MIADARPAIPAAPHAIPYQGSKRRLAPLILRYLPPDADTLVEPFCGSAAVSLAALRAGRVRRVHLNDSLAPLARLWRAIVRRPRAVADAYERLWQAQLAAPRRFYDDVRDQFNHDADPAKLLYLLARCVKNAVRFNATGEFNQSPDRRRLGTRPARMREQLAATAALLRGRAQISSGDYAAILSRATRRDVVYLDPPYQGTSAGRDQRYHRQLELERLIADLERLVARGVPVLVSFDGRCGDRRYGAALPARLGLVRIDAPAGRSTQATLHGRRAETVESLYVSPDLAGLPRGARGRTKRPRWSS